MGNNRNKLMRSLLAFFLVIAIVAGDVYVLAAALETNRNEEVILEEEVVEEEVEESKDDEVLPEEEEINITEEEQEDKYKEDKEVIEESQEEKPLENKGEEVSYMIRYRDDFEIFEEIEKTGVVGEEIVLEPEEIDGYTLMTGNRVKFTPKYDGEIIDIEYRTTRVGNPDRDEIIIRFVTKKDGKMVDIAKRSYLGGYKNKLRMATADDIEGYSLIGKKEYPVIIGEEKEVIFEYTENKSSLYGMNDQESMETGVKVMSDVDSGDDAWKQEKFHTYIKLYDANKKDKGEEYPTYGYITDEGFVRDKTIEEFADEIEMTVNPMEIRNDLTKYAEGFWPVNFNVHEADKGLQEIDFNKVPEAHYEVHDEKITGTGVPEELANEYKNQESIKVLVYEIPVAEMPKNDDVETLDDTVMYTVEPMARDTMKMDDRPEPTIDEATLDTSTFGYARRGSTVDIKDYILEVNEKFKDLLTEEIISGEENTVTEGGLKQIKIEGFVGIHEIATGAEDEMAMSPRFETIKYIRPNGVETSTGPEIVDGIFTDEEIKNLDLDFELDGEYNHNGQEGRYEFLRITPMFGKSDIGDVFKTYRASRSYYETGHVFNREELQTRLQVWHREIGSEDGEPVFPNEGYDPKLFDKHPNLKDKTYLSSTKVKVGYDYKPEGYNMDDNLIPIVKHLDLELEKYDIYDDEDTNNLTFWYMRNDENVDEQDAPFLIRHFGVKDQDVGDNNISEDDDNVKLIEFEMGLSSVDSIVTRTNNKYRDYKFNGDYTSDNVHGEPIRRESPKTMVLTPNGAENIIDFYYDYSEGENPGEPEVEPNPKPTDRWNYTVDYKYVTIENMKDVLDIPLDEAKQSKYFHGRNETVEVAAKHFDGYTLIDRSPKTMHLDEDNKNMAFLYLQDPDETDLNGAYVIRHVKKETVNGKDHIVDILNRRTGVLEIGADVEAKREYIKDYVYEGYETTETGFDLSSLNKSNEAKVEIREGINEIRFYYRDIEKDEDPDEGDTPTIDPEEEPEILDPNNPEEINPEIDKNYTEHTVEYKHGEEDYYPEENFKPTVIGVTITHYPKEIKEADIGKINVQSSITQKILGDEDNIFTFKYEGFDDKHKAYYQIRYINKTKMEEEGASLERSILEISELYSATPNSVITAEYKDIGNYDYFGAFIDEENKIVEGIKEIVKPVIGGEITYFDFYYKGDGDPIIEEKDKEGFYKVLGRSLHPNDIEDWLGYDEDEIDGPKDVIYNYGYSGELEKNIDVKALDLMENPEFVHGFDEANKDEYKYILMTKSPKSIELDESNDEDHPAKVEFYYIRAKAPVNHETVTIKHVDEEDNDLIDPRGAYLEIGSNIEASRKYIKGYEYDRNIIKLVGNKDIIESSRKETVNIMIRDNGALEIKFVYKADDSVVHPPEVEVIDPEEKPGEDGGDIGLKDRYRKYSKVYRPLDSTPAEKKFDDVIETSEQKAIVDTRIYVNAPLALDGEGSTISDFTKAVFFIESETPKYIDIVMELEDNKAVFEYRYKDDSKGEIEDGEGSYTVYHVEKLGIDNNDMPLYRNIVEPMDFIDKQGMVITLEGKRFPGYGEPTPTHIEVVLEEGKHKIAVFVYEVEDEEEIEEKPTPPEEGKYSLNHITYNPHYEEHDGKDILKEDGRNVLVNAKVDIYDYSNAAIKSIEDGKLFNYYMVTPTPSTIEVTTDSDTNIATLRHGTKLASDTRGDFLARHTTEGPRGENGETLHYKDIVEEPSVRGKRTLYQNNFSKLTPNKSLLENGYKVIDDSESVIAVKPNHELKYVEGEGYSFVIKEYTQYSMVVYEHKDKDSKSVISSYVDKNGTELSEPEAASFVRGEDALVAAKDIEGYKVVGDREVTVDTNSLDIGKVTFQYTEGEEIEEPETPEIDGEEDIENEDENIENPEDIEENEDKEESTETPEVNGKPETDQPSVNGGGGGGGGSSATEVKDKEIKSKELDKIKEKLEKDLNINEEEALEIDSKVTKDHTVSYLTGFSDGTIRPTENTTREEVATIIYRVLEEDYRKEVDTKDHAFKDVKDIWSEDFIATLANAEIIEGFKDGSFKPKDNMTRAEVATMIARLMDLELTEGNEFADTTDHWAAKYINAVANEGWVDGYTDGSFRPNEKVTRAELVTMINNMLGRSDEKVEDVKEFKDLEDHRWYYDQIQLAIALD